MSVQRRDLRKDLINYMVQNTTLNPTSIKVWGLETKQLKFYEYCKSQLHR